MQGCHNLSTILSQPINNLVIEGVTWLHHACDNYVICVWVVFTPVTRGLYQLHVRVHDIEIPGSPVSVSVSVPPEKRGTPVKTISGLRRPSGVAVTDDGLVIVSERDCHCISLLDKEGKKIRSFCSKGRMRQQLRFLYGLALTSNRTILVADRGNNRISRVDN